MKKMKKKKKKEKMYMGAGGPHAISRSIKVYSGGGKSHQGNGRRSREYTGDFLLCLMQKKTT